MDRTASGVIPVGRVDRVHDVDEQLRRFTGALGGAAASMHLAQRSAQAAMTRREVETLIAIVNGRRRAAHGAAAPLRPAARVGIGEPRPLKKSA